MNGYSSGPFPKPTDVWSGLSVQTGMGVEGIPPVAPPYGINDPPFDPFSNSENYRTIPKNWQSLDDNNGYAPGSADGVHAELEAAYWSSGFNACIVSNVPLFVFKHQVPAIQPKCASVLSLPCFNVLLRKGFEHSKKSWETTKKKSDFELTNVSDLHLYGGRVYERMVKNYEDSFYCSENENRSQRVENLKKHQPFSMSPKNRNKNSNECKNVLDAFENRNYDERFSRTDENFEYEREAMKLLSKRRKKFKKSENIFENSIKVMMNGIESKNDTLRYLSVDAIADCWDFYGIVRSSPYDESDNPDYIKVNESIPIGVTVAKKCKNVFNYWGNDVKAGDLLWFVLKKNEEGCVQCYPMTNGKHDLPEEWIEYRERETIKKGLVIKMGLVLHPENPFKTREKIARDISSGLMREKSLPEIMETTKMLDFLTVHLLR